MTATPITRTPLPNRRMNTTQKIDAFGKTLFVTAGFDQSGKVKEIFFAGGKEGSSIDAIMGDVAVVISVALQYGIPASDLAKSIARIPCQPIAPHQIDGTPAETITASPVGTTIDWIINIEAEGTDAATSA